MTVRVADALIAVPPELVTEAVYAVASADAAEAMEKLAAVALRIMAPFLYHW